MSRGCLRRECIGKRDSAPPGTALPDRKSAESDTTTVERASPCLSQARRRKAQDSLGADRIGGGVFEIAPRHFRTAPSHYKTIPSHFRTALSHFRTASPQYETATSHYRTTTSHSRTAPSHSRTALRHYKTVPSQFRTEFSGDGREKPGSMPGTAARFRLGAPLLHLLADGVADQLL